MLATFPRAKALSQPISQYGLVAEGGGQRGIFTAGVLDSWQQANFNPFQVLIGTSAGAQNIASYVSQQPGYALKLILDLTTQSSFYNPWRLLAGKNVMDLDWYFTQASVNRGYRFDCQQADMNASNRIVRFSSSNPIKLTTQLLDPSQVGWLKALQQSSAIPYLYKSPTNVDGGVTAPVPVLEAHQLGATKIVTIRTSDNTDNLIPKPIEQLKPLLCQNNNCPTFIRLFEQHKLSYVQAEQFIAQPPANVEVLEIKPNRPLRTKTLGSSKQDMMADYYHGREQGQAFLQQYVPQQLVQFSSQPEMDELCIAC